MAFHTPPQQPQGQYRYDPTTLHSSGPSRLFPGIGEDGLLRYVLAKLGLDQMALGKCSQPWSLLLQQVNQGLKTLDNAWSYLTTQLVDLEVFQSGWFNLDLPPDEQFNASFVRDRRRMTNALLAAKKAAERVASPDVTRLHFYDALQQHQYERPIVWQIHQRDGGLSDREFAHQRVAGQNPVMLRQVQPLDRPLLDSLASRSLYAKTGDEIDLVQAANQHQLFVADYPLLQNLSPADLQPSRYVGSPTALFYHSASGLEPILIQPEPGHGVTPSSHSGEADRWMQAKLFVQVADVTYHELITHLCQTHLAMEAFAIATPRQFPANHPLYRLLRPHFQFLLAINTRGNAVLLSQGAAIDQLMAPTRETSLKLMNRAYRERPFGEHALPQFIQRQGVGAEFLPDYPYRDDALLLWNAIARYVTAYLQRHYTDDTAVQQDPYLQAWAAELGEPLASRPASDFPQAPSWLPQSLLAEAGLQPPHRPQLSRIPGFSAQLSSLQQLIDIATQIIFTCGPQHAAVNFSQFDYVGYTPNAPLAAYCQPGDCRSLDQLLPPREKDLGQMELAFALSGIRWGKLGSPDLVS
jgi:arachidonate 15-lipoxygenase